MNCKKCGHSLSEHLLDSEYQDDDDKFKKYPKNTYHRSCMISGCLCSKIVKIKRERIKEIK